MGSGGFPANAKKCLFAKSITEYCRKFGCRNSQQCLEMQSESVVAEGYPDRVDTGPAGKLPTGIPATWLDDKYCQLRTATLTEPSTQETENGTRSTPYQGVEVNWGISTQPSFSSRAFSDAGRGGGLSPDADGDTRGSIPGQGGIIYSLRSLSRGVLGYGIAGASRWTTLAGAEGRVLFFFFSYYRPLR
jgi:hypothetical protein